MVVQVAENLSDVDRALALLAGSHPAQLRAVIAGLPTLARQHGGGACAAVLAALAAQLAGMEGDAQARAAPGSGWPDHEEVVRACQGGSGVQHCQAHAINDSG